MFEFMVLEHSTVPWCYRSVPITQAGLSSSPHSLCDLRLGSRCWG